MGHGWELGGALWALWLHGPCLGGWGVVRTTNASEDLALGAGIGKPLP